ncbi:MAG: SCP2 domain-containing protein [Burkholderiales bacterium]
MLDASCVSFVNHLLRGNGWARQRLKPFAGSVARIDNPPFTLTLAVRDDGEIAAAGAAVTPAVTIRLTPGQLLRIMARDETVWQEIAVEGDTGFAAALSYVARNLRWDVEEDLSRVFGDIVAHRLAQAGRTLDQWRVQSFDNLARSFAEYWTEEQPLIARARDLAQFNREVDELRDDVARLEKRIERLSGAIGGH